MMALTFLAVIEAMLALLGVAALVIAHAWQGSPLASPDLAGFGLVMLAFGLGSLALTGCLIISGAA